MKLLQCSVIQLSTPINLGGGQTTRESEHQPLTPSANGKRSSNAQCLMSALRPLSCHGSGRSQCLYVRCGRVFGEPRRPRCSTCNGSRVAVCKHGFNVNERSFFIHGGSLQQNFACEYFLQDRRPDRTYRG